MYACVNTYAPIHTPVRNVRTHIHMHVVNDRHLHRIKTLAITREAITAFTSLLKFGASSNATIHTNSQKLASHVVQN